MSGVTVQKPNSDFVLSPLDGGVRQPNFEKLKIEVIADPAITTDLVDPFIRPYDIGVPDVGFEFAGTLSGAEDTALDILIAAHDGLDPVRGNDTHTFLFAGIPGPSDDETVIGVGGLPKYAVGDFGFDTTSGPPFDLYSVHTLDAGNAAWTKVSNPLGGGAASIPSLELIMSTDATAVSTTPGPIGYNVTDSLEHIQGFFSYSSPTLTCLKACFIRIHFRADYTVNSAGSIAGLRLDLRKNGSSVMVFDEKSERSTDDDGQSQGFVDVHMIATDTITVYCNSYIAKVNVWGGPNRMNLTVMEDLS